MTSHDRRNKMEGIIYKKINMSEKLTPISEVLKKIIKDIERGDF